MERPQYKRVRISEDKELKSGLEEAIHIFLTSKNVDFTYEGMKIVFSQPTKQKKYTPDFPIKKSFIIEAKGLFNSKDRKKHRLIKEQHPNLDIRIVFQNPKGKIRKGSKTTYAMYCDKHDILWAEKEIPKEWLK